MQVDNGSNLLQGLTDRAALLAQGVFDLVDSLSLVLRQVADSSEDQLFRGPVGLLADLPAAVGTQSIAGNNEDVQISQRLTGVFTGSIFRGPVIDLRVEEGDCGVQHGDQFMPPGGLTTGTAKEGATGIQLAVMVDHHSEPFRNH